MGGTGQVGYGPLYRVDGPPPIRPEQGLLRTAEAPTAGVRIVPETDDRWMNGVDMFPYPSTVGALFDTCALGSDPASKDFQDADVTTPQFGAFTAYLSETCKSRKVWDQEAYRSRALLALTAVESALVSKQLMYGSAVALNPYLANGNGTFPNGDVATSPINGLEILEGEIAKSGRNGLIHCSPMAATSLMGVGFALSDKSGAIRTINGIVIVPDFGYVTQAHPIGHPAASGTTEWMFASGPVDIRRSEMFIMPGDVSEALDRGTGTGIATTNRPNTITYRAERYYLVDWDTAVQAAVLVDRCKTTC